MTTHDSNTSRRRRPATSQSKTSRRKDRGILSRIFGSSKKPKKRRSRRKKGRRFSFLHLHSWVVWTCAGAIAVLYVLLMNYIFVDPFSFRWKALYGDTKYPGGYGIHGIDVSHHQATIDWEKLRNASIDNDPIQFVFIKATEGVSIIDQNFNDNFYQAKQNDFVRGAYHFFSPQESAKEQALYFLKQVHLEDGDLPPVLDVETTGNLDDGAFKNAVLTWLRIVGAKYHVNPILYTSYKFKLRYLNDSVFNKYPYWIAHYYVEKIEYKGNWKFWQHTDCGKLPGIKGYVDFDIYNGSMYDLRRLTLGGAEEEED